MSHKPLVIAIMGPTASGKSALAVEVAQLLGAEIISIDSRQVYSELNLGVARPEPELLESVPHHLVASASIHSPLNAATYAAAAKKLMKSELESKGAVVLVGGSTLYYRAIFEGLDAFPEIDLAIRTGLNEELESKGLEALVQELLDSDPIAYETIDRSNPYRVLRALEVCRQTDLPYSSFLKAGSEEENKEEEYKLVKINLQPPRDVLYQRINTRCEVMMKEGLMEEVKSLVAHKDLAPLQTVGYTEWFAHLAGDMGYEEAMDKFKQHTRNYAKRQMTWLRKEVELITLETPDLGEVQKHLARAMG